MWPTTSSSRTPFSFISIAFGLLGLLLLLLLVVAAAAVVLVEVSVFVYVVNGWAAAAAAAAAVLVVLLLQVEHLGKLVLLFLNERKGSNGGEPLQVRIVERAGRMRRVGVGYSKYHPWARTERAGETPLNGEMTNH